MIGKARAAATLALLVCLCSTLCHGWQAFQTPEQQPNNKPRPEQKDSGFAPPEASAPSANSKPAQEAGFAPPEAAAPTSNTRQQQQETTFKTPEAADQPPPRTGANSSSFGTNPLMGSARARLDEARNATDIRIAGGSPFRMHVVFSGLSAPELAAGGTYTELWVSPKQWRREAAVGNIQLVESRDGELLYRKVTGLAYVPRLLDDMLDGIVTALPGGDDTFIESEWQQGSVLYERTPTLRIASGFSGDTPSTNARAFWLSDAKPVACYQHGFTVEYTDYEPWNGKQVSRHRDLKQGGVKVAGIWIDDLRDAAAQTSAQFALEGVTPYQLSDATTYTGPYFVPPQVVHQVAPKDAPAGSGTVVIAVHLDAHGHVRSASVKQGINPALDHYAEETAMEWEFSPALLKGRPSPSDATVQFAF